MKTVRTDVAIIGAGTAGLSARREAARTGARTLLIEEGPYGTTCARVGCMPSKLLIAAADAAHAVDRAPIFGIEVPGGRRVDGRAVMARVRRERDRFVSFVVEATEALPPEERLRGRARFLDANTLAVGDDWRVEARAIVVATGARPFVPAPLEPLRERLFVSDDLFDLEDLPASMAVLGAGVVALEMGQALQRLGVRVSFFSPGRSLGPISDPRVDSALRGVLEADLSLHLEVDYAVEPLGGGFTVSWKGRDGRQGEEAFERVLVAAGRRPRVEVLDLPRAGVDLDEDGAPRFDPSTLQCGDAPVFIAGDANGDRPVLHEAADEGSIAGRNAAAFPEIHSYRRRAPLSIIFTDPQMAVVGGRFADLEGDGVEIGSVSYEDQGRARVIARNRGLVRIYAERASGRLLGAEMFGPSVEHLAHLMSWAVQRELTVSEAHDLPFYHPVVEEGVRRALRDICTRLEILCASRPEDLEQGPGA